MVQKAKRLYSIDVFRSITMFFMIFVNDLSGTKGVPKWIDHVKIYEDGMHFADTIFPLFLFIAGLSIPLAIGRRINRGDSFGSVAWHILTRSFALIVMGFFQVNLEEYSHAAALPQGVWELLLTFSFFLLWLDYPETMAKAKKYAIMALGAGILIALAVLYKGGSPAAPHGLEPSWWGILGIIGWAYLICAGLFLLFKGNFTTMLISLLALVGLNVGLHAHWFEISILVVRDGSSAALMMFGVVISLFYAQLTKHNSYDRLWIFFSIIGVALITLGFIVRPYTEGISKIRSTPAWVFICTGIGVLLFEFLIWLIDIKGKQSWFKIIRPAGTSTLTCYLIPYFIVAIFYLINFKYPHFINYGTGGIVRSFAMSFLVIFITALLEKKRLRLKI